MEDFLAHSCHLADWRNYWREELREEDYHLRTEEERGGQEKRGDVGRKAFTNDLLSDTSLVNSCYKTLLKRSCCKSIIRRNN